MPKRLSQADLARHFGVSRVRILQLAKEGMPTNSIRAAELWKEARGKKRRPTNGNLARNVADGRKKGRPKKRRPIPNSGDSLYDALQSAIAVQERAYEMVEDAMAAGSDETVSIRLGVHNKAVEARFRAEEMYRQELERRNILVQWNVATDMVRKVIEAGINRLKRLPQAKSQQCNPSSPLIAFQTLEEECESIIAAMRAELNANAQPTSTTQATDQP